MAADLNSAVAFKVPRESDGFPADPGLSFPLVTLQGAAPGVKLFWIVRHPLDAICSLRVGIARSWGHHPRPPDWRSWADRALIERCAHHWAYLKSVGFAQVWDAAIVVTFEDMIADLAAFAQRVTDKVGVVGAAVQPDVRAWIDRVQNENNDRFIEAQTSRSYSRQDHKVRVGRWRENISDREIAMARPIVAEMAEAFGCRL